MRSRILKVSSRFLKKGKSNVSSFESSSDAGADLFRMLRVLVLTQTREDINYEPAHPSDHGFHLMA